MDWCLPAMGSREMTNAWKTYPDYLLNHGMSGEASKSGSKLPHSKVKPAKLLQDVRRESSGLTLLESTLKDHVMERAGRSERLRNGIE